MFLASLKVWFENINLFFFFLTSFINKINSNAYASRFLEAGNVQSMQEGNPSALRRVKICSLSESLEP